MPATPEMYAEIEAEIARRRKTVLRVGVIQLASVPLLFALSSSWQWTAGFAITHGFSWSCLFTFHKRQVAEARRNLDAYEPPDA